MAVTTPTQTFPLIVPYTGSLWYPYTNFTREALLPFLTQGSLVGAVRITTQTHRTRPDKHLITLVKVNVGTDLKRLEITIKFSNRITSPEDANLIGPELCRRAAIGGNFELLKALRRREWGWDVSVLTDGSELCAKWAYDNGCPNPANKSYEDLRPKRNLISFTLPAHKSQYEWN